MKRGMYGELELTAIDRKGNCFKYSSPNTLTFEASRVASHLLVGHLPTDLAVGILGVGTGSTPPERGDGGLEGLVYQTPVTEILRPAPGHIEFVTILDFVVPANGSQLTEAGLYCLNGTSLFARQVHTSVTKDDNFKLEYVWRIVFT